ncbi:Cellobiose dehydrogenase [Lachnellula suecica]|uniref:Cellobiose dehydrogenase n=1 Tax=Lachnellula suecica TaxID=602035 RepID=A0A8T9BWU3_9HELO|nr:Cellobiose dehydrogenase [Lachnellula suecica]
MVLLSILSCTLAVGAAAQTIASYTEPKSGITVQAYQSPTFTFGLALPTTPKADFIGVLVGQGSGYAGISLGGAMTNELLIAAWPNGNSVLASFRETPKYGSPPVVTGTYSMIPIANGTYVNSTHYTYTFLCRGCILADGTTFTATSANAVLGYAYSTKAPTTKANVTTAFSKHDTQGNFGFDLTATKTASYDVWAQYAKNVTNSVKVAFRA